MSNVHHFKQDVCLGHFFESSSECRHQTGRQLLDETHSISDQNFLMSWQFDVASCWIQGGEKLVFGHHLSGGERVEESRFTGVRITDDRDNGNQLGTSLAAYYVALQAHTSEQIS